jgi:hypothetical protein
MALHPTSQYFAALHSQHLKVEDSGTGESVDHNTRWVEARGPTNEWLAILWLLTRNGSETQLIVMSRDNIYQELI